MVFPVSRWISRVLRYSGISRFASPLSTGLSPSLVGFPTPFLFSSAPLPETLQPHPRGWFGLFRVRSPLLTESSLFLGLLRCFSSPGSPNDAMNLRHRPWACPHVGFPIRISLAHADAHSSPELFAVYRVLLRHEMPRHPPYALVALPCVRGEIVSLSARYFLFAGLLLCGW